jgi:hypothetical protein
MCSRSSISRNHTSHRAAYRSWLGIRLAMWDMAGVHTTTHRGG